MAARVRELMGEPAPTGASVAGVPRHSVSARWEPSRAAVVSLLVLLVAVVAATAWWYLGSQAPAVPVASTGGGTAALSPSPSPALAAPSSAMPSSVSSSPGGSIVVDVAGKVVHPGVYRLAAGSRVDDAVRAAGGAAHGVSTVTLKLAAPLHDGDQVVVGEPGATAGVGAAGAGAAGAASGGTSAPVDLNTATAEQLDALPGVGPVLAQHIVDWRTAHGGFTSIDQLQSVSGIGDAKYADLRSLVSV
ncbi:MAG: hypothetical protein JWQ77_452 [Jatrophihabitans sp.]|nr:hypothetical protein [Jatrophihabitans sp.]